MDFEEDILGVGDSINELELDCYHNGQQTTVKQEELVGKWIVLFFYPADFTFVCPTELQELAGLYEKFTDLNTEIISVSTDTVFSHKAWHDSSEAIGKVKFPMAADTTGELAKLLGVYIYDEGLARRGTFIIDPDGMIKAVEINDNSIGRSAHELLRKIKAAKFVRENGDKVCPASWEPGDETLEPGMDLVGKS